MPAAGINSGAFHFTLENICLHDKMYPSIPPNPELRGTAADCPKCGKAVQAGNLIAFNKTRHTFSFDPKGPEDTIISQKAFSGSDFHGFICKSRELVVFDYPRIIIHW